MNNTGISVINISKSFKNQKVLENINVDFKPRKIHGIIGRNGSGKTVLLKCLCGLLPVDSGKITINGLEVGKDMDMPEDIGVIIETPGFLPHYSGLKNLTLLSGIRNRITTEQVIKVMESVGLDPYEKKGVGKYSLGMKQRLGIAQAVMEEPSILILDEPMNGLDNNGVEDMRNFLLSYKETGKTVILASHIREDIEYLCDTVLTLDNGQIKKFVQK